MVKSRAPRPAYFVGPCDLDRRLACVPKRPEDGTVVMVRSEQKGSALPFHRQKLVLVLSAQQHFAEALARDGFEVEWERAPNYVEGIASHVKRHRSSRVVALEPREWGLWNSLRSAGDSGALGAPLELASDGGEGGHFLLTREEFTEWARGRRTLRMDLFYGWMRKRTGWLMEKGQPIGGKLSFDAENRRPAKGEKPPALPVHSADAVTRRWMKRAAAWPGAFGSVEGFDWPVTRAQALAELDDFFKVRAKEFGPFQDAMLAGEKFLWHSRLSTSLNLGLLHPREVIERALEAYRRGVMPLASAEGFVRQIAGWREYLRGMYWLRMPAMRAANALGADLPLPDFYWDPSKTEMRCMRECVDAVAATGYAHHIQRLMVLGNFALLAGIRPIELSHWFWAAFVDAFEWVELPNVHGMALFADDGFTTKPYAASGAYIHRMSNYCEGCRFDVSKRTGDDACPFNALYWSFLARHRKRLAANPRIGALYRTWDRWSASERAAIEGRAKELRGKLRPPVEPYSFADDAG